jgi:hypothetical protein
VSARPPARAQCLLQALQPRAPPAPPLTWLLVPLHPLAAAAAHAAGAEAVFAARAVAQPALRAAHRRHLGATLLAGALFVGEEVWPEAPCVHAAWHLAAAAALSGFSAIIPTRAAA